MLNNENFNFSFFVTFFSIQFAFHLFNLVLPLKAEQFSTINDTAFLHLTKFPFQFMLIANLITEVMFVKSIGKNKSWFLFPLIVLILCLILLFFSFDWLVLKENSYFLFAYLVLSNVNLLFLDSYILNRGFELCNYVLF